MPYSVPAVVNTMLDMAKERAISDMSPMKIQKLLYFAQAWHLKLTNGEPLIDESFSRWQHGPVIPSLYHGLKGYGYYPVTSKLARMDSQWKVLEDYVTTKDNYTLGLLNKILDVYGPLTGSELSILTHREGTAWALKGPDGSIITNAEMMEEKL